MGLNNKTWIPKVLSLVAAVVLWIFVMNEQNPLAERVVSLPVTIQNLDSDRQIVVNSISNVQVKIRAPRLQLAEFNDSELKASIDLKGLGIGTHEVSVKILPPQGIDIVEVSNPRVEVALDDLITQQVHVVVGTEGTIGKDVQVKSLKAIPSFILATGPASEIGNIKEAKVTVNLNEVTDSFKTEATPILANRDKLSSFWRLNPSRVVVEVEIKPKESKIVEVNINTVGDVPSGYEIEKLEVVPEYIKIRGSSEELSRIDSIETVPFDLGSAKENEDRAIDLVLPETIQAERNSVQVILKMRKISQ